MVFLSLMRLVLNHELYGSNPLCPLNAGKSPALAQIGIPRREEAGDVEDQSGDAGREVRLSVDFQEWSASSVTVLGPGCLLTTIRNKRQIGIV